MSRWHDSISQRVRDVVLRHYLVPYSRFGLDAGLVPHLPRCTPVTLVDIGANRGDFAAAVEAHCGLRSALLVEPQPPLAEGLKARFPGPEIQVHSVALSDTEGRASLDVLAADSCSSLLTVKPDQGFSGRSIDTSVVARHDVALTTLDHLLAQAGWSQPIDLLKIDTQGTELQVLRGAAHALARVRLLWIEVSFVSLYEQDVLFPELHAFLRPLGFRLYSLHDVFRAANRELLQADALFLGPLEP